MPIWLKQQKNNWQGIILECLYYCVMREREREKKPVESVAMIEQDARE